jgi:signal transduction histidine kinase
VPAGRWTASGAVSTQTREEQRCFLAYAAHELRSSITTQRILAEVALADPNADIAVLREMGEQVAGACEQQEWLLEALLTLAQSEYGRLRREPVELAAIAAKALQGRDHGALTVQTELGPP